MAAFDCTDRPDDPVPGTGCLLYVRADATADQLTELIAQRRARLAAVLAVLVAHRMRLFDALPAAHRDHYLDLVRDARDELRFLVAWRAKGHRQ